MYLDPLSKDHFCLQRRKNLKKKPEASCNMVTSSKGQSQRVEHMLESSCRSRLLRTVKISLPADPVSSELTHSKC